jgi:catechol 2,3-dioxygenase-like lactoylglutathione lyase family enzyme
MTAHQEAVVEQAINALLNDFEHGRMSRRQLVQGLAVAAAAVWAPRGAAAEGTGFTTVSLDHISYQVADYKRTRDFYADLMGMKVSDDNGTSQAQLHFGEAMLLPRNRRQRPGEPVDPNPKPLVDHIAYRIGDWNTDKVKAELERRGLQPRLDTGGGPNYVSFHVQDPDGFDLQISGTAKPGDSQYKKPGA